MKTVIYGSVTQGDIDAAGFMAGIVPTAYITNGRSVPPVSNLEVTVIPHDKMVGDAAVPQNHWRLVLHADAMICKNAPEHLLHCAKRYDLLIYEV